MYQKQNYKHQERRHRKHCFQPHRGGFVLGLVAVGLIILLVTGAGLVSLGMHRRGLGVRSVSEIAARSAADAGLTKALLILNKQLELKTLDDSSLPQVTNDLLPDFEASFSYHVVKDNDENVYTLESIGTYGLTQRTVNSTLALKGLFENAIFVENDITLKNGTIVVAYNLDADEPDLAIGTNSTDAGAITTRMGVTIDGDIIVGVDGDPTTVIDSKFEAAITGDTYAEPMEFEMPSVTVPQYLLDLPSGGTIIGSTTISSSAKYDCIDLTGSVSSDIVTIDAPVELYVIGDIRIGFGDELRIVDVNTNPDASLTLYLGGNLIIDYGGLINNLSKDTHKLTIYGLDTCTNIDFKNSGTFYGAIYAPNADVRLHNSVQMYGAVVSNSFIQDVNADFYYDASLRIVEPTDIGVRFVITRWYEQ